MRRVCLFSALMLTLSVIVFTGCHKTKLPTVVTSPVTEVTATRCVAGGVVTSVGDVEVIERGVCWGVEAIPEITSFHQTSGTGLGTFTCAITGLQKGTTYYVRAYVLSDAGTTYGESVSFTTLTADNEGGDDGGDDSGDDGGDDSGDDGGDDDGGDDSGDDDGGDDSGDDGDDDGGDDSGDDDGDDDGGDDSGDDSGDEPGLVPEGALKGLFSVSATEQVYFSKGNLQYMASTNTWRFAENQYQWMGLGNQYISETYDWWIDLFGWGTSNHPYGATCYQPWSTSLNNFDYYLLGSPAADLSGAADWGSNSISNGGGKPYQWRTLTKDEWYFVLYSRATASGVRYVKAKVNGANGVLLLPDDFDASMYSFQNTDQPDADFSNNTIDYQTWPTLEEQGVVFLPRAGTRISKTVNPNVGKYWTATTNFQKKGGVYCVSFDNDEFELGSWPPSYGSSVRLVYSFP